MSAYVGSSKNLKDSKDRRKHGLATEQFLVSSYVGSSKNLKDLKDRRSGPRSKRDPKAKNAFPAVLSTEGRAVVLCWEKLLPIGPKKDLKGRDSYAARRLRAGVPRS